MSKQKLEPFESRLNVHWPHRRSTGLGFGGPRAIVIPLPEDYEGPVLGEACESRSLRGCTWFGGRVRGLFWDGNGLRFDVGSIGSVPLDRIRHPQPKTVEIDGRHYPADDVQRALECHGVEPVEES